MTKHDSAGAVMLILQFTIIQHRIVTSENGKKQCSVWPSSSPTLSDINPTCKKQIDTNAVLAPFLSIYHGKQKEGLHDKIGMHVDVGKKHNICTFTG